MAQVQRHWPWLTCSRRGPYITEGQPTLWRCMPAFRSWFVACGGQRFTAPLEKSSKEWAAPLAGTWCCSRALLQIAAVAVLAATSFKGQGDVERTEWIFSGLPATCFDIHFPHNRTIGFVCGSHRRGQERWLCLTLVTRSDRTTDPSLSLSLSLPLCSSDLFVLCSAT